MPRMATAAEMPTRKREGGGRTKVYDIDLTDLPKIVGKLGEDGKPLQLVFGPQDMASETGDVAQLSTFTNQVRKWVEDYNKGLGEDAETHYTAKTRNYPIRNGDVHVRGTINPKTGEVQPADPDADDYEDYTELYESWISVVPLTEKDLRNRRNRQAAKASKNGSGDEGESEDEDGSETGSKDEATKATAKASK